MQTTARVRGKLAKDTHTSEVRQTAVAQPVADVAPVTPFGHYRYVSGAMSAGKPAQGMVPVYQRQVAKSNHTGLPDQLKSGIESLSGISMDRVKVHYNSGKPAQLSALAYAQGRDIHLAPGQEQHLPHEAWHLVQQAQGRVKPTTQMSGVAINDNRALEHEADTMGAKALQTPAVAAQCTSAELGQFNPGATPVQRFGADDLKFLFRGKFGLRHHDDRLSARMEALTGTQGGDAVPLNPMGFANVAFPLMGRGEIPVEVIDQFSTNVDRFIAQSLNRTVNIELGVTTPRQVVERALENSTFLLVSGLNGADVPKDVDKKDYGGLGKAGKQKISANQIEKLMAFDEVGVEFMQFLYGDTWDTPIETREEGEDIFQNLVLFFSESLKDAVYKMRTGEERFMQEDL